MCTVELSVRSFWTDNIRLYLLYQYIISAFHIKKQNLIYRRSCSFVQLFIKTLVFLLKTDKILFNCLAQRGNMLPALKYLGKTVSVTMDRPLGSRHPKHGFVYKANYGFLPGTVSGDGEEIDAYVLNIDRPLQNYTGKCTAVIHRTDDNDDKLVIIPQEDEISDLEIETQTAFQEKWFKHIIIRKIPAIHLICGFIGFGKTTYAKRLEQELPAVRFTHDEIMCARYGRSPEDFPEKYKLTDKEIRRDATAEISRGHNVILDYGFWSKKKRQAYYRWARQLTPEVCFHVLRCDLNTAKERVLKRNADNLNELFIDENAFNILLQQYEPLSEEENYPAVFISSHPLSD